MLPALLWGRPNAEAGSALIWCLEWRSRSEYPIAISEVYSVDSGFGSVILRGRLLMMVLASSSADIFDVWSLMRENVSMGYS